MNSLRTPDNSEIRSILRDLNISSTGDIEASAMMTTDGHIIASAMKEETDEDRFAAMCASLLALAEHASSEVAIGEMRQVMVMGKTGVMLLTHAGDNSVLAISASPRASLGKVLLDAKKAATRVQAFIAKH